MSENTITKADRGSTYKGLLAVGALGAAAAAGVNSAIFGIGRALDVPYVVVDGGSEENVILGGVIIMSVVTFAIGLAVAALAVRVGKPGLRTMAIVGGVVAVVSNAGFPWTDASLATKYSLAAMHLVVGVAYVATLEIVRARHLGAGNSAPAATRDEQPVPTPA